MKLGRDYSWWVDYTWQYEYFDKETNEWQPSFLDNDAQRFDCKKKDIKKTVTEYIKKYELAGEQYRKLTVTINDSYMTTTEEL